MKYFAYVLASEKDRKFYYGYTKDLEQRLKDHNRGKTRALIGRLPVKLLYFEECASKKEAKEKEKYFKSGIGREYIKRKIGA